MQLRGLRSSRLRSVESSIAQGMVPGPAAPAASGSRLEMQSHDPHWLSMTLTYHFHSDGWDRTTIAVNLDVTV